MTDLVPHTDEHHIPPTHTAFTPQMRDGKFVRWLAIGSARKGPQDTFHVRIDFTPVDPADFTGHICLTPIVTAPIPPRADAEDWQW